MRNKTKYSNPLVVAYNHTQSTVIENFLQMHDKTYSIKLCTHINLHSEAQKSNWRSREGFLKKMDPHSLIYRHTVVTAVLPHWESLPGGTACANPPYWGGGILGGSCGMPICWRLSGGGYDILSNTGTCGGNGMFRGSSMHANEPVSSSL